MSRGFFISGNWSDVWCTLYIVLKCNNYLRILLVLVRMFTWYRMSSWDVHVQKVRCHHALNREWSFISFLRISLSKKRKHVLVVFMTKDSQFECTNKEWKERNLCQAFSIFFFIFYVSVKLSWWDSSYWLFHKDSISLKFKIL